MKLRKYVEGKDVVNHGLVIGRVNTDAKYIVFDKLPSQAMTNYFNSKGYRIVFRINNYFPEEDLIHILKIGKFYATDDITTAALLGFRSSHNAMGKDKIYVTYMSYNQIIKGKKVHAEQILIDAKSEYRVFTSESTYWYMDLEPCAVCLRGMVRLKAKEIYYHTKHKEKWNTDRYFEVVKEIASTVKYQQLIDPEVLERVTNG